MFCSAKVRLSFTHFKSILTFIHAETVKKKPTVYLKINTHYHTGFDLIIHSIFLTKSGKSLKKYFYLQLLIFFFLVRMRKKKKQTTPIK